MIFHRTLGVPIFDDYAEYRPYLRVDFQYRCAYCLTHEHYFLDGEAGEIDHHRPLKAPPRLGKDFSALANVYENLYWACRTCNRTKGNRWPTDWQYDHGRRFLDPCQEDHDDHWDSHSDGTLTAKTPTGKYTIKHIRLDREGLTQRRKTLHRLQAKVRQIEEKLRQKDMSAELRAEYEDHLSDILDRIYPPVFQP